VTAAYRSVDSAQRARGRRSVAVNGAERLQGVIAQATVIASGRIGQIDARSSCGDLTRGDYAGDAGLDRTLVLMESRW